MNMGTLKDRAIRLATSKNATIVSMLLAFVLWLAGTGNAAQMLVDTLGLPPDIAVKAVNFAKLAVAIAAANGYSLLNRPPAPDAAAPKP